MVRDSRCSDELIAGCNRENLRCYESLEAHLVGMKLVIDMLLSNYLEYVDRELVRLLGLRFKPNLLYVTAALHDLGKALPHYQERLRARCTAPYHELASVALLPLITIEDLVASESRCAGDYVGLRNLALTLIALPILMHHHAMRPLSALARNVGLYVDEALPDNLSAIDVVSACSKYLSICSRVFGLNLNIRKTKFDVDTLKRFVIRYVGILRNNFTNLSRDPKLSYIYRLSVIVTKPLLIADIISASVNRACRELSTEVLSKPELLEDAVRSPMIKEVIRWVRINDSFKTLIGGVLKC